MWKIVCCSIFCFVLFSNLKIYLFFKQKVPHFFVEIDTIFFMRLWITSADLGSIPVSPSLNVKSGRCVIPSVGIEFLKLVQFQKSQTKPVSVELLVGDWNYNPEVVSTNPGIEGFLDVRFVTSPIKFVNVLDSRRNIRIKISKPVGCFIRFFSVFFFLCLFTLILMKFYNFLLWFWRIKIKILNS